MSVVIDERERVKDLVDLVPEADLPTAARMLRALEAEDAIIAAIENAPEDDEGELSGETIVALAESRRAAAEGEVVSDAEMRRHLGLCSSYAMPPRGSSRHVIVIRRGESRIRPRRPWANTRFAPTNALSISTRHGHRAQRRTADSSCT